ncbi:MAG: hypothetical protein KGL18_21240 [Burkholderiales bacterium]|nr:hypothetical protein [Burkholderiales bacterium]MDE1929184.1 hypothetical protein [Burkholderiales bacterium]MDE2505496.1 hypothetical protein [Burkholderiales bacterium]
MDQSGLWDRLRTSLGSGALERPRVVFQHLGLTATEIEAARALLAAAGDEIGVALELGERAGEIVLVGAAQAGGPSPQIIHAFAEGRPVIRLADPGAGAAPAARRQFIAQFEALLPMPRTTSGRGEPAFDSAFDSHLDAEARDEVGAGQRALVEAVLRGRADASLPALEASYQPGANLYFDFARGQALIDPLALQYLVLERELPQAAPGARPGAKAVVRTLDQALWKLGLACAALPLRDQPEDWWHRPLRSAPGAGPERYTRQPLHLEMAHRLAERELTPSQLRRSARVGTTELRAYLQACLMLGLLQWAPAPPLGH